jgi:tRNA-(ms[2]io[6]A)-hydroxylase
MNATAQELPLRMKTPEEWAHLALGRLDIFLADHAICEMQASLTALSLIAHYPEDEELVDRMTSLAIEEATHMRKVTQLMRERNIPASRRRANPYVQALVDKQRKGNEAQFKLDRLLTCALIEARSCERFSLLHRHAGEDEKLASLLGELGPAEYRHWEMFHQLASRGEGADTLEDRWQWWLDYEASVMQPAGREPTVHG